MVNIDNAHAIDNGLSFDDEAAIFFGEDNPLQVSVGDTTDVPIGSIYFRRLDEGNGNYGTDIWQRWGAGPNEWRSVFQEIPIPKVQMIWSERIVQKHDWLAVGSVTNEYAAYLWASPIVIKEVVIQAQRCVSSSQTLDLYLDGTYDRTLTTLSKSNTPITSVQVGLNWVIGTQTKIHVRAGSGNGTIRDVRIDILAEKD